MIVLWDKEPTEITDGIRSRFPYIKVTYYQLKYSSKPLNKTEGVPKGANSSPLPVDPRNENGLRIWLTLLHD